MREGNGGCPLLLFYALWYLNLFYAKHILFLKCKKSNKMTIIKISIGLEGRQRKALLPREVIKQL